MSNREARCDSGCLQAFQNDSLSNKNKQERARLARRLPRSFDFKNKERACSSRRCRAARHTKKTSWAQGKGGVWKTGTSFSTRCSQKNIFYLLLCARLSWMPRLCRELLKMGVFKPVFEQFRGLKSLDCERDSWYNKTKLDMFTSDHRT